MRVAGQAEAMLTRRRETAAGHGDVKDDDVRQLRSRERQGRWRVHGLADDLDVLLALQGHDDARPEQGVVVGDGDPDRLPRLAHPSSLWLTRRALDHPSTAPLWSGHQTRSSVPLPGADRMANDPPSDLGLLADAGEAQAFAALEGLGIEAGAVVPDDELESRQPAGPNAGPARKVHAQGLPAAMTRGVRQGLLERAEERDLHRQGHVRGELPGPQRHRGTAATLVVLDRTRGHGFDIHGRQLGDAQARRHATHVGHGFLEDPFDLRELVGVRWVAPLGSLLQAIEAQESQREHLAGAIVKVGADPPHGALVEGRGALRRREHAVAELGILVEEDGQLGDLPGERLLLAPDGVAATLHDAEEECGRYDDGEAHHDPRRASRIVHLLVRLARREVELGHRDDAFCAALTDRHVELEQARPARALPGVLLAAQVIHGAHHLAPPRCGEVFVDREGAPDELLVRAVDDLPVLGPEAHRADAVGECRRGEVGVERPQLLGRELTAVGQGGHAGLDDGSDVERRDRGGPIEDAALELVAHPDAH